MEWKPIANRAVEFIKKYRYPVLILLLGLVLMLIPTGSRETETVTEQVVETQEEATMEERLEELLSQIQGAGKVRVMLSYSGGEQTLYQTNDDVVTGSDSSTIRQDAVTVTDSDRNETGLVKQVIPATYLGAIVLCQGADSAAVRLAIADAVSKITGLGTDKISILKMK